MIISTLIGLLTFVLASTVHYLALAHLHRRLNHEARSGLPIVVSGIVGAGLAHLAEAALYATSFTLLDAFDLGGFKGGEADGFMDIFYFSLVNYTSLGLGDIYPTGHSRFLAGLESLNGFLLISCSASFIFLLMRNQMDGPTSGGIQASD